jgi:hypothetical protein
MPLGSGGWSLVAIAGLLLSGGCGGSTAAPATPRSQSPTATPSPSPSPAPTASAAPGACARTDCLYAVDSRTSSVASYAVAPRATPRLLVRIAGPHTQLAAPAAIAVGSDGTIYVSEYAKVLVFAANAQGDVTPLRVIEGQRTGLGIGGIAVDGQGTVYAGSAGGSASSVRVFAPGASGDVAPIRVLGGIQTQIIDPHAIALDEQQDLIVADINQVYLFPPLAAGDVAPSRSFGGRYGWMVQGVAALGSTAIAVLTSDGTVSVRHGGLTPNYGEIRVIHGSEALMVNPTAIAAGHGGTFYVANGDGSILVFGGTERNNAPPLAVLEGTGRGATPDLAALQHSR